MKVIEAKKSNSLRPNYELFADSELLDLVSTLFDVQRRHSLAMRIQRTSPSTYMKL